MDKNRVLCGVQIPKKMVWFGEKTVFFFGFTVCVIVVLLCCSLFPCWCITFSASAYILSCNSYISFFSGIPIQFHRNLFFICWCACVVALDGRLVWCLQRTNIHTPKHQGPSATRATCTHNVGAWGNFSASFIRNNRMRTRFDSKAAHFMTCTRSSQHTDVALCAGADTLGWRSVNLMNWVHQAFCSVV